MAGLLDLPDFNSAAGQGLLAASLSLMGAQKMPGQKGAFGSALANAGRTYMDTRNQAGEQLQAQEYKRLQLDALKRKMEQEKQQAAEAERVRNLIAGAGQPKLGMGGTSQVNDSLPLDLQIGAMAPLQEPGKIDFQALVRAGVPFDLVKQLADSQNLGKQKVARTVDTEGPNGSKLVQGFDEFGQPAGQGVNGYVAPVSVNQGNQTSFVKPMAGLSLPMGMSPSERDASSARWASQGLQQQKFEFDKAGGVGAVNGAKPVRQGPMSVTLQKELLESDDVAQSSSAIVDILTQGKKINKTAYSGYGAKPRAVLASNMPWDSAGADATINLDNMMTGQALESLKSIFGGMPTEGERKILLDMQASAEKTPAQREAIMDRAIAAAQRRGVFAAQKAKAIRGGTYLTEGIAQDEPAKPKADAMSKLPTANASNKGRRIKDTETGKILVSNGMTWVAQ